MTLAAPLIVVDGIVRGVIGIDLSLKRLSEVLLEWKISPDSVMYIVDGDRNIIAAASTAPLFSKHAAGNTLRLALAKAEKELGRALAPRLAGLSAKPCALTVSGESVVAINFRLSGEAGLTWSLVIAPRPPTTSSVRCARRPCVRLS